MTDSAGDHSVKVTRPEGLYGNLFGPKEGEFDLTVALIGSMAVGTKTSLTDRLLYDHFFEDSDCPSMYDAEAALISVDGVEYKTNIVCLSILSSQFSTSFSLPVCAT